MISDGLTQPAAIALGSNLGDSLATLEAALVVLNHTPGIQVIHKSPWYLTPAIGPPQPDYLNGCACLAVTLSPDQLLTQLLAVESQFGRVRQVRWGARTLDLDLLLYGDRIIDTPELQVPHPRMQERAFVLVPLADIAPSWVHPVSHRAIAELRQTLDCKEVRRLDTQ